MNTTKRNQRTFLTVTSITVVALTTVFLVYAAVLLTLTGNTVTITEGGGSLQYTLDGTSNSSWTFTLPSIINGTEWYARINITGASVQDVTIDWTLQIWSGTWTNTGTPTQTTITLAAGDNTVYATPTGVFTDNRNWGLDTTAGGQYRVEATVNG